MAKAAAHKLKPKPLMKRVEEVLSSHLTQFQSGLMRASRHGQVFGYVVSSDFRRLDHWKRQEKLKRILKSEFSEKELFTIGPIVTMTPAEADVGKAA